MLFHKSFISFTAAISLADSITASVTPVRRGDSGCSPGTGSLTCCDSTTSFGSLTLLQQTLLSILDPELNDILPVGLGCIADGTLGCNNQPLCCDTVQNQVGGLINVAASCIDA
ncbi:hypothetical protein EI94DRAFT_1305142 [Lactarius quietus]|nr:hypothetical protein EI94DRAFT_1305142 [Lactarius quietus]